MTTPHTQTSLIETLRSAVCMITFKKLDGSLRDLRGTLREDLLPTHTPSSRPYTKNTESDAIRVYDLESDGWRSFNLVNLISFQTINE